MRFTRTRLLVAATLVATATMSIVGTTTNAAPGDPVFQGLVPARLLETRQNGNTFDGQFNGVGAIGQGATLNLTVVGRGGVPASGVTAVALNVTATEPSASSFITVFPKGATRPTASNLNFVAGQTIPNMVIVPVGADGAVSIFNLAGNTHVLVDVLGWFPSGSINALTPGRLLETRQGGSTVDNVANGVGAVAANSTLDLQITGRHLIPSSGVAAVALNVTATEGTASSFLTVYPKDAARPTASNLNFVANQTIPNMVIVPVGTDGKITLYNLDGNTHVLVDVLAWFPTAGATITGVTPARLLETRPGLATIDGLFNGGGKVNANTTLDVRVVNRSSAVPSSGVSAVALNVTVTNPTASSFLTVFPKGATRPSASNLNFVANQTIPNMVIVPVGTGGEISVYNPAGATDVIIDVLAWFPDNGTTPTPTFPVTRINTTSGGGEGTIPGASVPGGFSFNEGVAISRDGNYAAFSTFSRLDGADTDDHMDVYRKNLNTGAVVLVSVATGGGSGGAGDASEPAISADGNIIAFHSGQQTLATPNESGGDFDTDIFVRNITGDTTTRVSLGTGSVEPLPANNAQSNYPSISADGATITYQSTATNIVAGDTNSVIDGFVWNAGVSTRATVSVAGAQATGGTGSFDMRISDDGSVVVFSSDATNLVTGDTNTNRDVFKRTVADPATIIRVNLVDGGTGQSLGGDSTDPEPSQDGRYVVFDSMSNNLTGTVEITGPDNDIFVRDTLSNITIRVSSTAGGGEPNGVSGEHPMINDDGTLISFSSAASDLVSGDTNGFSDVFRWTRTSTTTGTNARISIAAVGGAQGNGDSDDTNMNGAGNKIVFRSASTNLVSPDSNGRSDLYLYSF